MQKSEIEQRFATLEHRHRIDEYNFEHFRPTILWRDAQRTVEVRGIKPGEYAPDFELTRVGGGALSLAELRGQPVILHFGSFS